MRAPPVLLAFLTGCEYSGPDCDSLSFRDLTVDTSGAAPVFSWSGDQPNYLFVVPGEPVESPFGGIEENDVQWRLDCQCEFQVSAPDSNRGCKDSVDHEFRACLPSPLTYGLKPETTLDLEYYEEPVALTSGSTYTVGIQSYCQGEKVQDDAVNGGDPFHVGYAGAAATFVMP